MTIDFTWKEPTEEQTAALDHAMRCAEPALQRINRQHPDEEWAPPVTEFHIAEMMCMAAGSLWYTQACQWAEGKGFPARGADRVWKLAGEAIKKIVAHGYQDGRWWDPEKIWESPNARAISVVSLVEITRMTRKLRGTLAINSTFFEVLPYLVEPRLKVEQIIKALDSMRPGTAESVIADVLAMYDPEFKKKLDAIKGKARQVVHEKYEPTVCIHPECENLVAPKGIEPREGHYNNYRGTGACQRGHNSYYCTRCKKPHSHDSKVGKTHYEKYNGGDFTAELAEKWKAGEL